MERRTNKGHCGQWRGGRAAAGQRGQGANGSRERREILATKTTKRQLTFDTGEAGRDNQRQRARSSLLIRGGGGTHRDARESPGAAADLGGQRTRRVANRPQAGALAGRLAGSLHKLSPQMMSWAQEPRYISILNAPRQIVVLARVAPWLLPLLLLCRCLLSSPPSADQGHRSHAIALTHASNEGNERSSFVLLTLVLREGQKPCTGSLRLALPFPQRAPSLAVIVTWSLPAFRQLAKGSRSTRLSLLVRLSLLGRIARSCNSFVGRMRDGAALFLRGLHIAHQLAAPALRYVDKGCHSAS